MNEFEDIERKATEESYTKGCQDGEVVAKEKSAEKGFREGVKVRCFY